MALTTVNDGMYEDKGWNGSSINAHNSTRWQEGINWNDLYNAYKSGGGESALKYVMKNSNHFIDTMFNRNLLNEIEASINNYDKSIADAKAQGKQVVDSATLQKVQQNLRDKDKAAVADVGNTQNVASEATQANINAGINKSLSGMLGSQTASETSIQSPVYQALANQNASTQADYLARLGEVQGLENQASNLKNAENNIGISSAISGAVTGASAGFVVSDERTKEYDNKQGLPKAGVRDALRQIESIMYKYKPETGLDQDKHVGITAQSLLGTPWEGIVNENGEYLSLDKQKLLEAVMAGIADLQKQIDTLEKYYGNK